MYASRDTFFGSVAQLWDNISCCLQLTCQPANFAAIERILEAPADVADPEQVQRLRDTLMAKFGKINLLANNAATRIGRGHGAPLADWQRAMDVNLWGPILGVRAFLPAMLASTEPGVIVNVGSKQGSPIRPAIPSTT